VSHGPIWLRKPRSSELDELLRGQAGLSLSYQQAGATREDQPPVGFLPQRASAALGVRPGLFDEAARALEDWRVHERAGLLVHADGPALVGTPVVLVVPLLGLFLSLACRVVYQVDDEHRRGFAYGTLEHHLEIGEELFILERGPSGEVRFSIVAYSRPGPLLAKVPGRLARRAQRRATLQYIAAMRQLTR
jgi:uncharacterized protein (UPF0548 family)